MKLVVLDYPDWLQLVQAGKALAVLEDSASLRVLMTRPETAYWKPAALFFITVVVLGAVGGVALMLWGRWLVGSLVCVFALFPLRKGLMISIKQEVLRQAREQPKFFLAAISSGALRFFVNEADLVGVQHLDGRMNLSGMDLFLNR